MPSLYWVVAPASVASVSVTLPVFQPAAFAAGASVCVVVGAVVSGSPGWIRKKSNTASWRDVTVWLPSLA